MKRNALLIGAFVIFALVIAVGAILWLSGNTLFRKHVPAIIYYRGNVSGLYVGAPVTFRGVSVGQVDDIGIDVDAATLKARIPVRIHLQPDALNIKAKSGEAMDLPALVQRGLRARLVAQSFVTGQKSIELDFLPKTPATLLAPPESDKPEIPAVADRFGALIDQVADLPVRETVEEMRATVKQLRETLGSVQQSLASAQGVLTSAAQEVVKTGTESRQTLAAATAAIQQVQASTTATLASITKLSDASRDMVLGAQPELQRTLENSREAAEAARLAMDRVSALTAPGAPLRGDLDSAVRDLAQAARSLRDWSELLEEKPNAIIFGGRRE
ncbi:MAG: MCE family protein [Proteobacteria bacterium]|nr:MCE family protein [Pseudomonadota bacterium]